MARKEDIRSAASDHRDWVCCGFIDPVADEREESFAEGAEWADKTMIDKACEWLEDKLRMYAGYSDTIDLVDSFRKAMEE